jgi:hypothetical protein
VWRGWGSRLQVWLLSLSFGGGVSGADLSFNKITMIEGLESLTKLTDLSLFSNQIKEVTGLSTLVSLDCLSLGNNQLTKFSQVCLRCSICTQLWTTVRSGFPLRFAAATPARVAVVEVSQSHRKSGMLTK